MVIGVLSSSMRQSVHQSSQRLLKMWQSMFVDEMARTFRFEKTCLRIEAT
jgi:hypothetical protein